MLKIINLLFAPIPIFWNIIVFSALYFLIGSSSAFIYFESVSKRSVKPILRIFGAKIGKRCLIETGLIFHNCSSFKNLTIGNKCYIGKHCFFDLTNRIIIKDNADIAMKVTFITHQDFYLSSLIENFPKKYKNVVIKEHSHIGVGSTIIMATVGNNAYIGAGIVVNKDTVDNAIMSSPTAKTIVKICSKNEGDVGLRSSGVKKSDIIRVVSSILTEEEVTIESSMENTLSWDSLNHIAIIVALKDSLSIEFEPGEVVTATSIENIFKKASENK